MADWKTKTQETKYHPPKKSSQMKLLEAAQVLCCVQQCLSKGSLRNGSSLEKVMQSAEFDTEDTVLPNPQSTDLSCQGF